METEPFGMWMSNSSVGKKVSWPAWVGRRGDQGWMRRFGSKREHVVKECGLRHMELQGLVSFIARALKKMVGKTASFDTRPKWKQRKKKKKGYKRTSSSPVKRGYEVGGGGGLHEVPLSPYTPM